MCEKKYTRILRGTQVIFLNAISHHKKNNIVLNNTLKLNNTKKVENLKTLCSAVTNKILEKSLEERPM